MAAAQSVIAAAFVITVAALRPSCSKLIVRSRVSLSLTPLQWKVSAHIRNALTSSDRLRCAALLLGFGHRFGRLFGSMPERAFQCPGRCTPGCVAEQQYAVDDVHQTGAGGKVCDQDVGGAPISADDTHCPVCADVHALQLCAASDRDWLDARCQQISGQLFKDCMSGEHLQRLRFVSTLDCPKFTHQNAYEPLADRALICERRLSE